MVERKVNLFYADTNESKNNGMTFCFMYGYYLHFDRLQ